MELDYFKLRLISYLKEHGFEAEDLEAPIVENNAETAGDTFETMRRNGMAVDEALEFSTQDLFSRIGESPREVFANILIKNFKHRLLLKDQESLELWIRRLSDQFVILEEFRLKDGLGLDPKVLEESRGDMIHRIDQYLNTHGF